MHSDCAAEGTTLRPSGLSGSSPCCQSALPHSTPESRGTTNRWVDRLPLIPHSSYRLRRFWAGGHSHCSVSRPQPWVHLRCGSDLRDHGASTSRLLDHVARVATCIIGISHGEFL